MGIRIEGFDELERTLKDLSTKVEELAGEHSVPFSELFDEAFMLKYTSCRSIQELMDNSGFKVESQEDFAQIPDDEWDAYIQRVTEFADWKSMMETAAKEYVRKRLGL